MESNIVQYWKKLNAEANSQSNKIIVWGLDFAVGFVFLVLTLRLGSIQIVAPSNFLIFLEMSAAKTAQLKMSPLPSYTV